MKGRQFFCALVLAAMPAMARASAGDSLEHDGKQRRHYAVDSNRRFYLWYENDLFAGADRYYSQGVHASLQHPVFRWLNVGRILAPGRSDFPSFNLTAHLEAYTPTSIRSDTILRGDRPYAGVFYLTAAGSSRSTSVERWEMSGALSLGVIGPVTQGKEIQTRIHEATGNAIPLGWQHQIRNDLLLNYSLTVLYRLAERRTYSFTPIATADVGSFYNRLSAGMSAALYPLGLRRGKAFTASLHSSVKGMVVGYDARLQGGLLNRTSPYVISAGEISRLVLRADFSVHLQAHGVFVGVNYAGLTREFQTGFPHAWGGLNVGFDF